MGSDSRSSVVPVCKKPGAQAAPVCPATCVHAAQGVEQRAGRRHVAKTRPRSPEIFSPQNDRHHQAVAALDQLAPALAGSAQRQRRLACDIAGLSVRRSGAGRRWDLHVVDSRLGQRAGGLDDERVPGGGQRREQASAARPRGRAALARAGGWDVQAESYGWVDDRGAVDAGQAAVTTAGEMPASGVIHVVRPRWREGQDNDGLREAVCAVLDVVDDHDLASVTLPAISAGVFGVLPGRADRDGRS